MKMRYFEPEKDGFYGVWYPNEENTDCGMILMLGDSSDDHMVKAGVKWVQKRGCHAFALSAGIKDYGYHSYPLETFGKVIDFMHKQNCRKIGIAGASTTGVIALTAASYYPGITLTIAMSPADFVMEGFIRDNLDGMRERPGSDEAVLSWQGKTIPYLPYAYRHPEYWQKISEESKRRKDMAASRDMFDESERRHPLQEEEFIKVEKIRGTVLCIGAEDDSLWDTCRYIRRMEKRLAGKPHECQFQPLLYEHGTHFVFPQSMLKKILPVASGLFVGLFFKAGRDYPKECLQTRKDIDEKLSTAIARWRHFS